MKMSNRSKFFPKKVTRLSRNHSATIQISSKKKDSMITHIVQPTNLMLLDTHQALNATIHRIAMAGRLTALTLWVHGTKAAKTGLLSMPKSKHPMFWNLITSSRQASCSPMENATRWPKSLWPESQRLFLGGPHLGELNQSTQRRTLEPYRSLPPVVIMMLMPVKRGDS